MLELISAAILPCVILLFIGCGVFRRVDVFDAFLDGARKGLGALVKTAPALIALTFAVKLLRGSGLLDAFSVFVSPVCEFLGIPAEIMPLALLRPVSGSGSTALLTDMFEAYGPDSKIGLMASVLCCASETTFYTVAVYYGSCGIKKTRHTVPAALLADLASVIFSILFVNLMFSL